MGVKPASGGVQPPHVWVGCNPSQTCRSPPSLSVDVRAGSIFWVALEEVQVWLRHCVLHWDDTLDALAGVIFWVALEEVQLWLRHCVLAPEQGQQPKQPDPPPTQQPLGSPVR